MTNRTKKRNNYTLSAEAQKIVDGIPNYKKSGFVSEAIVDKDKADKFKEFLSGTVADTLANIYAIPENELKCTGDKIVSRFYVNDDDLKKMGL